MQNLSACNASDYPGSPEGEDDGPGPINDDDPQMDVDAVAPSDPLIEQSKDEPPTPTKVRDLLKKHQAKTPDDNPNT